MTQNFPPSSHNGNAPGGGQPVPSSQLDSPGYYPSRDPDEIDLRALFLTLRREWLLITLVFVLVVAAVAVYTYTRDPVYQATSIVMVDVQQQGARWNQNSLEDLLSIGGTNRSIENETAILRNSIPLAERVAGRLLSETQSSPLTSPIEVDEQEVVPPVEYVARMLLGNRVTFSQVDMTDLIQINTTSTDPQEAARVSNIYAEEYVVRSQEMSRASISGSRVFLEDQERSRRQELDVIEERLSDFMTRTGAIALDSEAQHAVQQLGTLDAQIEQAQVELEIQRTQLTNTEAEIERIEPGLTRRMSSGVFTEMEGIHRQIAELRISASEY